MGILDIFRRGAARPLPTRHARGPFLAASQDRLTASWLATQQAINDELRADLDKLRARARELAKNNDYARKFLRMVSRNLVGPAGFILQARVNEGGQPDSLANNAIEAAHARWARRGSCEITGRMNYADLQRNIAMSVARDGEALVMIVRGKDAGNPEGMALQLLDAGRIDTQKNIAPGNGRNAVVMGVEIDRYSRAQAYFIKQKPDATSSERVPARDVLHIFLPENPEQVRGLPWMHAAMLAMHDLGEFNRSALMAARKGADTLGFIISPDGTAGALGEASDSGEQPIRISAPGTYDVLPEGYDIRTPDSNYPNQVYDSFVKAILRRIASGLDVAYNGLANDLEGVNYSSIRAGVLEERDQWMTLQNWYIDAFLEPVFDEWFARAMTAGTLVMPNGSTLPAAKAEKFRRHEWQGRRWSWVDPLKDIEAARLAVKSGIASPQMIAAQNGVDVEDVLDATAAFEKMAKAKGVTFVDYDVPAAPVAPQPTATDNAVKLMASAVAARAAEPPAVAPAPTFNIAPVIHTPEVRVDNHLPASEVHVAAPAVAIRNEITTPEPVVHVDAHFEVRMPDQEAPTVNVNVELPAEQKIEITAMPERVTTTAIERGADGNIKSSKQTEKDA